MKETDLSHETKAAYEQIFNECAVLLTSASMDEKEYKEITYIKSTLKTERGGVYLLSFVHIDGTKINLDQLREEAANESQKQPEAAGSAPSAPNQKD